MRDFFQIFNLKMQRVFGDPKLPEWKIEKALLVKGQNPQIIGSMLYAYDKIGRAHV